MRFLRKKDQSDPTIYIWTPYLLARGDMEECEGPEALKAQSVKGGQEVVLVKEAIAAIPRKKWGKAGFGRPSMPKIADVEAITGYPVTIEEVIAALDGESE